MVVSGVHSAGLTSTAFPAASAGAKPHDAIVIGKFHGVMTPTTPRGSLNVTSSPPSHRNLLAGQPLRGGRVELQHVADVAGLPFRVADRMPGVGDLQLGQLVDVRVDRRGEGSQRRRPLGGGQSRPVPLCPHGARDRVVDPRHVGLLDGAQHPFGGGIDYFR